MNNIPSLLSNGTISGVFLNAPWDAYDADGTPGNRTQFKTVLGDILTASGGSPIKVTLGIIAGMYTTCNVLSAKVSGSVPIYDNATSQCILLPIVYNTPSNTNGDNFASAYTSIVKDAVSTLTTFSSANPTVTFSALKLGGLDTDYSELHITGNNSTKAPSGSTGTKICNPGAGTPVINYTCPANQTGGEDWYFISSQNGYYPTKSTPSGVQKTWDDIYPVLYSLASANGALLEIDTLQSDSFPPIYEPAGSGVYNEFACNPYGSKNNVCDLYPEVDDTSPGGTIGTSFMEGILFTDLFNSVPPQAVGVQLDGLGYIDANQAYRPPTAAAGFQSGQNLGVPVPCWTYYENAQGNNHTVVGFQSATGLTYNTYLQGLQYGENFGARYIETHPSEVNDYFNIEAAGNVSANNPIKTVNESLQSGVSGNQNCQWPND